VIREILPDVRGTEVLARFGAEGMPAIHVVDANGIVRLAESGDGPERLRAVGHVVAQRLPRASEAR